MNSSPEDQVSDNSLNLSEKMPKSIDRLVNPMNSYRTEIIPLKIPLTNCAEEEMGENRNPKMSPTNRGKKIFLSPRRSNKIGFQPVKRNLKSETNMKDTLALTKNLSKQVSQMVKNFRQNKKYKSIENLSEFHYRVIGDACSEKAQTDLSSSRKDLFGKISKGFRKTLNFSIFAFLLPFLKSQKEKIRTLISIFNKIVPTFNPNNPWKIFWDFVIITFTFLCLFAYSIERAFVADIQQRDFNRVLMFVLYVDVGINLNTKYYVDGIQIKSRKRIFKHYIKGQGIRDLIPILAISVLNFNSSHSLIDLNLCLLLTFLRLYDFEEKLKELIIKNDRFEFLYNMLILLIKIFLWAHVIACLWHYVGFNSICEKNWIRREGIFEENWETKYLYSIYWSVTTMLTVGYGDITPTNSYERIFNIWAMIFGCGIFGYTMNRIGEILKDSGKKDHMLREKMKKVTNLLKGKNLPHDTEIKVKKYMEFVWAQEQREDPQYEELVMNKLSSHLRDEFVFYTRARHLKKAPIFKNFSDETLISLATRMKTIRISPEEYLCKKGDSEEISLYLVIDGRLDLVTRTTPSSKLSITWKSFQKEDFIGIQEIITGLEHSLDVVAVEFSTLFQLSRKDLIDVLKQRPLEYEKFCKIKDMDILYKQYNQYEIVCNSCGYNNHRVDHCEFFTYQPGKFKVIGSHILRKKGRHFKRKQRPTFNSLLKKNTCAMELENFHLIYNDDEDLRNLGQLYTEEIPASLGENSEGEGVDDEEEEKEKLISTQNSQPQPEENALVRKNIFVKEGAKRIIQAKTYMRFKSESQRLNSMNYENERPDTLKSKQNGLCPKENIDTTKKLIDSIEDHKNNMKIDKDEHEHFFAKSEKVRSFQFYFNWNNVENVLFKYNKFKDKQYKQSHIKSDKAYSVI